MSTIPCKRLHLFPAVTTLLFCVITNFHVVGPFCFPNRNSPVLFGKVEDVSESILPDLQLPENTWTEEHSVSVNEEILVRGPRRWSPRRLFKKASKNLELTLKYNYKCDKLLLQANSETRLPPPDTVGVVLIHPIGVGIARWYYERLLNALKDTPSRPNRFLILSPDLLGSGSACDPTILGMEGSLKHLPLLNISDWTEQLLDLMETTEVSQANAGVRIDRWCVVANGGCSPIALQVAARSLNESSSLSKAISNVIISSSPRLPFFLKSSDASKVARAYKRLCGLLGRLFWWYACRREGKFIQKFSEKNLVSDPANLGDTWRSNCYRTATAAGGMSRYSTFAFLAGCLQDGCQSSLDALKDQESVQIDVIKGRDIRMNQAKSWFWQKSKRKSANRDKHSKPRKTFRDYVEENGNGGRELSIGGRVSLAHEDPVGYAKSIVAFLGTNETLANPKQW